MLWSNAPQLCANVCACVREGVRGKPRTKLIFDELSNSDAQTTYILKTTYETNSEHFEIIKLHVKTHINVSIYVSVEGVR